MNLGEYGAAMRELDPEAACDTFTFFGEEYQVVGGIPAMLMLQLGAASSGKIEESEALAAIWEALRLSLDEPDREVAPGQPKPVKQFGRLYKAAVAKRCELEPLMRLAFALFEAQDESRPTEAAPDSGPGPLSTSPSSRSLSSHPEYAHLRPVSEVLAG